MKRLIRWLVILGFLGGLGFLVTGPLGRYMKERNRVVYRDAEVTRGRIAAVVNATGTIQPVLSVKIGSVVSGPIVKIYVDYNSDVKVGDPLADVDPKVYQANLDRDQANVDSAMAALLSANAMWDTRKAEVKQALARRDQASNDKERYEQLQALNKNFTSATEMDKYTYDLKSFEALVDVAKASVKQAQAAVKQAEAQVKQAKAGYDLSKTNLGYTKIESPVDGIVIERKIDAGQTMAAQFQTPELFVIGKNMREEMLVFAAVDEADIGYIVEAEKTGQPVHFTVESYPDELFKATILPKTGIRMNSTTTQNVVTYPVVVSAPNPDLKLRPGMTANVSFQLREKESALRIPNAALRFYPQRDQVRPEDRHILENKPQAASDEGVAATPSAQEKAEARRHRNRRHVWVVDGDFLRAVEVVTGLSSAHHTEMVAGELVEDQKLVTGIQPKR
ncbi:MAG: efflux RND transporter periplasmic adaptor subunit [Gemmataceae bacterium]|nr:efflux RND transporter periplasmic adaptor subunit [Gemmataceae bacterium]